MFWKTIDEFANRPRRSRKAPDRANPGDEIKYAQPEVDLATFANRPRRATKPDAQADILEVSLPPRFREEDDDTEMGFCYTLVETLLDVIHIYHFRTGGWRIVIEKLGGKQPVMWNIDPKRIRALRSEIAALARGYITPAEFAAHLSSIEQVQGEI